MFGFFKVGETAFLRNAINLPELNGVPVRVEVGYGFQKFHCSLTQREHKSFCYIVKIDDGPYKDKNLFARYSQLTRKKLPEKKENLNAKVEWADCAWKPKQVALEKE